MNRISRLFMAIQIILAIVPVAFPGPDAAGGSALSPLDAPRDITEAYLRFHDEKLCLGVDALFTYNESGLKVWCQVRDTGDYKKLLKLLKPLSASRLVETFAAEIPPKDKDDEEDDLPPSLWENSRLRALFWLPMMQLGNNDDSDLPLMMITPEEMYRRRLELFAEQILDREGGLKHFAEELPLLTRLATDRSLDADMRALAIRVCRNHAEELDGLIGKLEKNMKQALPDSENSADLGPQESSPETKASLPDLAVQISERSRSISRRVYGFVYPDEHTVDLHELRDPNIFHALRVLRNLNEEYVDRTKQLYDISESR